MQDVKNKRVTVAGLGHFGGGVAVARWLVEQGARVLVTDKESPSKLADSIALLRDLPIEFRIGEHRESDFTDCEVLVISPAIKPDNPFVHAARNAGVPVTLEIALFIERCVAPIVGVTGTKGKSTTSTLLEKMLATRFTTWLGGNIGVSLLEKIPQIKSTDIVVLELSSYMLEYLAPLRWSPHVAVLTMLAEDHLDWHGSVENYISAKRNIVSFQRADDLAVLPKQGSRSAEFAAATRAKVIYYGGADTPKFKLALPGEHNVLNAAAAFAAAGALGVEREVAQQAIASFAGLPHRLEYVGDADGVRFYNDSIATVPAAAVAALKSFPSRKVIQIVGGSDKGLPYAQMCDALAADAKAVLCIGTTGPTLAGLLSCRRCGELPSVRDCQTLESALDVAAGIAEPGDVVLLSPGCASYDQFSNFEQRGDQFRTLVAAKFAMAAPAAAL